MIFVLFWETSITENAVNHLKVIGYFDIHYEIQNNTLYIVLFKIKILMRKTEHII